MWNKFWFQALYNVDFRIIINVQRVAFWQNSESPFRVKHASFKLSADGSQIQIPFSIPFHCQNSHKFEIQQKILLLHVIMVLILKSAMKIFSNTFLFNSFSLGEFSQYIPKVGRPYHWVQWLCGLQFLNHSEKAQKLEPQFSASHIESTIKRLRRRVKARVSLAQQLACLGEYEINKTYNSVSCLELF